MGKEIPRIPFAYGNWETGHKALLMEDVGEGIQTGYFFGPGSPHNWGRDLAKIVNSIPNSPTAEVNNPAEQFCMILSRM